MTRLRYQDAPPGSGLASVVQAATRLNPCLDLDVDIVAIEAAAGATSNADWTTLGLPAGLTVAWDGSVMLTKSTPSSLFSQTGDHSVNQQFNDSAGSPGPCIMWLDFFPDAAVIGAGPLILANIDLWLGKAFGSTFFTGTFVFNVTQFDDRWNRVPLCSPIQVQAKSITTNPYTLNLGDTGQPIVFYPGQFIAQTGQGLDNSGVPRNLHMQSIGGDPVSFLPTLRGFSIGIQTIGANAWTAPYLGCCANGVSPQFDVTQFWRVAQSTNRNCGPYDPYVVGAAPGNINLFPGTGMGDTGAVPVLGQSYGGAKAVTNGYWGRAKQILQGPPGPPGQGGRRQNPGQNWDQPYHNLRVSTYAATATGGPWVFNLGLVPAQQAEIRIDDAQPKGTSIAYTLAGSTTGTGGWVALGTVHDGQLLTGASLYQYYQLTAVFTSNANHFASPSLYAFFVTSRLVYNTFSFVANEVDSTVTIDPVDELSEIAEFKLPLNRIGPRDYNDPASVLNTIYSPTAIEAYVYAKNRISKQRYFLNLYRLENREPSEGTETMTFVSGLDQLSGAIPKLIESYSYPGTGSDKLTNVTSLGGGQYRVQVATTPWTAFNPNGLTGFLYYCTSGAEFQQIYPIQANTGNTITFTPLDANGNAQPAPAIGDTFQIHSQIFARPDVTYSGVDFAAILADLIQNQAAVPQRFQGALPATTGRAGTGVVTNDAATVNTSGSVSTNYVTALQYCTDIAVHCGGFLAWRRGRIDFVNFYGAVTAVDHWDDRHIIDLTPKVGADLRMPSIYVPYGYSIATQSYLNGATYNDANAVFGWGRANLYDIYQMPTSICRWNDATGAEALYLANLYLQAWSTGRRYWQVKTAMQYPWLQEGDAISIITDLYTDRIFNFSLDGLTDLGAPVKGRVQALGIIIGKNLWGDSFVLAIRGLSAITPIQGSNTNTGGAYTAIACPDITLTVEYENANGIVALAVAVNWTVPTTSFYSHMECIVQALGNTPATHQMGSTPPSRVVCHANTQYTFTPIVVTTGGVRTTGNPKGVNTGQNPIVTKPIIHGPGGGEIHGVIGTYTVTLAGSTPTSGTTITGTNPNAASIAGPTGGTWLQAAAGAVLTISVNPIAFDGNYTLTYTLTSSGGLNTYSVRALIEYSINGAAYNVYGTTPAQANPYTGTGVTTVVNLTGLLTGATSIAFRFTAEIMAPAGSWLAGTVFSTATFTSVAWNYSTGGTQTRNAIQLLQPGTGQPHMSLTPQANPPIVTNSAAGEFTMAALSAAYAAPQVNDGNAIATYLRYAVDYTTADTAINTGVGAPITMGSGIKVGPTETWVFEVLLSGNGNATGPSGIFVNLTTTGTFTTTDWTDESSSSSTVAFQASHGTGAGGPGVCLSYGVAGIVRQHWYVITGTSGTVHLTAFAQNGANPGSIYAGAILRGFRLA